MQFYKRTYGAVDYLVDAEGKLVTDDTVYVEVGASGNPNACVLSLCSQNQELSDIIAAWGKTSAVFSSQELGTTDYTITIGDNFVGIVGETATPAIKNMPAIFLRANSQPGASGNYVVDNDGKLIVTESGHAIKNDDNTYDLVNVETSNKVAASFGVSPIVFSASGSYATKNEVITAYGQTWNFTFSNGSWNVSPALEAYTE